MNYLTQKKFC